MLDCVGGFSTCFDDIKVGFFGVNCSSDWLLMTYYSGVTLFFNG
jgi:hypothetical protein